MLFGKKKLVLDIGPNLVKAAIFETSSKSCKMLDYSIVAIEKTGSTSFAISTAVSNLTSKIKKVYVAIGGHEVFMQNLTLPKLPESQWKEQIMVEVEAYVPYEVESVNINYIHLTVADNNKNEFLLFATPKQLVMQVQQDCFDAGLECEAVEPAIISLANIFEYNYGILQGQNIALLEVREDRSSFLGIVNGQIYFVKNIDFGLFNYDKALSDKLQLSIAEAQSLRKNFCLNKEVPKGTKEIIDSVHSHLQSEIQTIMQFIKEVLSKEIPTNLFLTGAAVALPGFSQKVSDIIPSEIINIFLNMKYDEQKIEKLRVEEINPTGAVLAGLGSNLSR